MARTYTYAIFDDADRATEAVVALDEQFEARKIDVLLRDPRDTALAREIPLRIRTALSGPTIGLGALIGATAVAIIAFGTTVFAGSPFFATFAGLLLGAFLGALVAVVAGLVTWRTQPDLPSELSDASKIMVGVATDDDEIRTAQETLAAVGAHQISVLDSHRRAA